mgnify:CR=1 FL=1
MFLGKAPFKNILRLRDDIILFSESNTRFIVEVAEKNRKEFESVTKGLPIGLIGRVSREKDFIIHGLDGKKIVDTNIEDLKEAWQEPLRW